MLALCAAASTSEVVKEFDDHSILTLMEFMALSRVEAINLLQQFGGSLDAIFETLL